MLKTRVIPSLLLKGRGLVKGQQFKNHRYVGDPINAVQIFNKKLVDELLFLDISATSQECGPNYELLKDIASEAFMPFAYGGGVENCKQVEKLFNIGVEKEIINSAVFNNPQFITDASNIAGSQSIVISVDVKRNMIGSHTVYSNNGLKKTNRKPVEYAKQLEDLGAGEIVLCSINNEGTAKGYDLELLYEVSREVGIPVVASGGAGCLNDFKDAINIGKVSAVAAGNMFIFQGKLNAVLPSYPSPKELQDLFRESNNG